MDDALDHHLDFQFRFVNNQLLIEQAEKKKNTSRWWWYTIIWERYALFLYIVVVAIVCNARWETWNRLWQLDARITRYCVCFSSLFSNYLLSFNRESEKSEKKSEKLYMWNFSHGSPRKRVGNPSVASLHGSLGSNPLFALFPVQSPWRWEQHDPLTWISKREIIEKDLLL